METLSTKAPAPRIPFKKSRRVFADSDSIFDIFSTRIIAASGRYPRFPPTALAQHPTAISDSCKTGLATTHARRQGRGVKRRAGPDDRNYYRRAATLRAKPSVPRSEVFWRTNRCADLLQDGPFRADRAGR